MAFPSLDHVLDQLRAIVEDDSVGADSKIADLGVDSLDVLEWVFEIEGAADITVDESLYEPEILETATVREVYERIKQAASA
ncbi:MAG: phosphopantetheine-binding protein [Acidimicrobiia bacterium]